MSEIDNLLSNIQRELKAPKSAYNQFGKYYYRKTEDILEAAKQLLPEGAWIGMSDRMVQLGDRFYVEATATLHFKGEQAYATAIAREADEQKGMSAAQVTGSSSTYARKYALGGLFALDDTKDDDGLEKEKSAPKAKEVPYKKELSPEESKAKAFEVANNLAVAIQNCTTTKELSQLHESNRKTLTALGFKHPAILDQVSKAFTAREEEIKDVNIS